MSPIHRKPADRAWTAKSVEIFSKVFRWKVVSKLWFEMEDQVMCQASINWESNSIQSPKKRRRTVNNNQDTSHAIFNDISSSSFACCKRFLPINSSNFIYESEDYKSKGETLYVPLRESVLVNVQNIEQFSFNQGSFFIGDESARFSKVVQGRN